MPASVLRFFNVQGEGMKAPWRLFWVAFAVRLLYMTLAHTYRVRAYDGHFNFGWEAGRIGMALANGYGFSDPFSNTVVPHTGPTAWLPPLYPLLVGGVFRLFGVYSAASAWVLLAINCVFSAATAMAVWEIGARCFGRRVALWAGWIWALHPAAMQYAVRWIWETTITTAIFACVIVLMLRMRGVTTEENSAQSSAKVVRSPARTLQWALLGVAWGLIALLNATLLLFLPVCGIWLLMGSWPDRASRVRTLRGAGLAMLIFVACVAPWTWRNWEVFHTFIPLRGNFGAEMCMGNGPGSTGLLMEYDHPVQSPEQLRLYASMGEVRYVAMRGALARAYIEADPAHFLADVAKRIYFFWISVPHPADDPWYVEAGRVLNFSFISLAGLMGLGLALRHRVPAAGLFAWAVVLLPVTYYIVTAHARFRHPLEPLLCVLGVYLFRNAQPRRVR